MVASSQFDSLTASAEAVQTIHIEASRVEYMVKRVPETGVAEV